MTDVGDDGSCDFVQLVFGCLFFFGGTWRIIPLRKWLVKGVTSHLETRLSLFRGLTNPGY